MAVAWIPLTADLLLELASFAALVLRSCLRAPVCRCQCVLGFVAAIGHPCIMPEFFFCLFASFLCGVVLSSIDGCKGFINIKPEDGFFSIKIVQHKHKNVGLNVKVPY